MSIPITRVYDKSQNRSYSQDMRKWSAELINHPITHQRLIDVGFKTFVSPDGEIIAYDKMDYGGAWVEYRSGCGFILRYRHVQSINDFHRITHESQLRHLYLMFTGFELNKL